MLEERKREKRGEEGKKAGATLVSQEE